MKPQSNLKRDPIFIALKHCINSCNNYRQLECLDTKVHEYASNNKIEGKFLIDYYSLAKNRLAVDSDILKKEFRLKNI